MTGFFKKLVKRYIDRAFKYHFQLEKQKKKKAKLNLIAKLNSVGYNLRLNGDQHFISDPNKVILGNNIHIGNNFYLKSEGGLIVGDNVHMSRNVTIYTENHNYNGRALPYDNTTVYKPVTIEENVWVGMNVSIVPGVHIGKGAIIGMGSVVNRDIEPFEIVGSPKTENLKYRVHKLYSDLDEKQMYGGVNGKPLDANALSKFMETYAQKRNSNIVFVLGTGRCGTVSITDLFNQHPNCKSFHENMHQIIRLSTDIAYENDVEKAIKELDTIFKYKIWSGTNEQLLVHVDQRFWNLVPYLSSYFPKSKFIHLIREPISCIRSMVVRNWYIADEYPKHYKHDWAKYRLQGDMAKAVGSYEWSQMSQLQKCTWYYYHVNNTIKTELKKLSRDRSFTVFLKDIEKELPIILKFCGLPSIELNLNKKNIRRDHPSKRKPVDVNMQSLDSEIKNEIIKYNQ